MADNILTQYLVWHFIEVPKGIIGAWKNYLKFNLSYFSVGLLLKTFFSPWRKFVWQYPRQLDVWKYIETFLSNLISRTLGAILRVFLIFAGVFIEIFIAIAGLFIFIIWMTLPALLVAGFLLGLVAFF